MPLFQPILPDRHRTLWHMVVALYILVGVTFDSHPCKADEAAGIEISNRKQLFLDDYLIATSTNARRTVHPAKKLEENPLIQKSEPWEDPLNIVYGSVIRDGDKYKIWYTSGPGVSYAESDDGIRWSKPSLDLVKIDGRKTNILFRKKAERKGTDELPYFHELFGVSKDEREPDVSRRYKMGFLSIDWNYTGPQGERPHRGQRRGLGVAGSPDGIHWKVIDSFASDAIHDGATHWMYDPSLAKYVLFGRTRKRPEEVVAAWSKYDWFKDWYSGRAVGRIESADFVNWNFREPQSAPVVMTADVRDEPGAEIYSMLVFPYESLYIGLVQVFHAVPYDPKLDVQLAVSHDGVHFTRIEEPSAADAGIARRASFISNGPIGSWDRFNQSLANNPPIAVGDELRFYYGGRMYRHSPYKGPDAGPKAACIGVATIKRDRFVSLDASFDGGEIVTKPLRFKGSRLHLNAQSDFGEIIVEALDGGGRSIDKSKPIRGDRLDELVEWTSGNFVGAAALRIRLKNACLYALWCD
jgi:hypothetical protein